MPYIDGFLNVVPIADKADFIKNIQFTNGVFIEVGATRVVESWGDDLPEGTLTDFRKAVQAKPNETVVLSWLEWPDRATRDQGLARIQELAKTDERFDPAVNPIPYDGKRMIFGGFDVVYDSLEVTSKSS